MAINPGDTLEAKQEAGIVALLNEPTVKQAAATLGIGERTLHRWLDEPAFAAAYRKARRLAFSHAISVTQHYCPMAVQTLAKILADPKAPHSAKVAAAQALLKFSRDSIELDDLAERVHALEAQQREAKALEPAYA